MMGKKQVIAGLGGNFISDVYSCRIIYEHLLYVNYTIVCNC